MRSKAAAEAVLAEWERAAADPDWDGSVLTPAAAGRRVSDHTISKEVVALRSALKLARRAGLWEGDPGAICPHAFSPEYVPRKRFLTREELCKPANAQQTDQHSVDLVD